MASPDDPTAPTRRRAALRWIAWALVIAATLELTARRYLSSPFPCLAPSDDPELVFALRPGTWVSDGYLERVAEARYDIASDGCQHAGAAPALLALGSSHGFGLAVPQRDAFPEALRRALAARGHDLRGTRNCSVPGHHLLPQIRRATLALADTAHPLVVILVARHHLRRAQDWSAMAPRSPLARWVVTRSRVARLVHLLRLQRAFEARPTPFETPERLRDGIARLAAAAGRRRAAVVLATLGDPVHPNFRLDEEARRHGIAVVPIGRLPQGPQWTIDDEHWTPRGHREVADRLTAPIDARLREGSAR